MQVQVLYMGCHLLPLVIPCLVTLASMRQPHDFVWPFLTSLPATLVFLPQSHRNIQIDRLSESVPRNLTATSLANLWPVISLTLGGTFGEVSEGIRISDLIFVFRPSDRSCGSLG